MKKVILLLFLFPYLSFGQIVFDFENGTTDGWTESAAGRWKADTDRCLNGTYSLHHVYDNPAAGADCIGIPLTNLHPSEGTVKWSFLVRHGYDPSSSNSWALYLLSDQSPASFDNGSGVNGFAAGVNLAGYDDTLKIWKITKGSAAVVASSHINWQTAVGISEAVKITVIRSKEGEWQIAVISMAGIVMGSGSGYDPALFTTAWLVLNYRYTSTRDRLLWLDDLTVEGVFYEDRIPPSVMECRVTGKNSLEVEFSEDPSDAITDKSLFALSDDENEAVSVIRESPGIITILFRNPFINKKESLLTIRNICDRTGNCSAGLKTVFTPVWALPGDIIISEIMADPSPPVSLPEKEYLELTNRTSFSYSLKNWTLSTTSQKSVLPGIEVGANEMLILCSYSDTLLFSRYGKCIGVKSFPTLTDEGRTIWISDSSGTLIHGIEYSRKWYGSKLKENGGWSLEMIDCGHPFYTDGNWEASSSGSGGTPGKINSASRSNPDKSSDGAVNVFPDDSISIILTMSETIMDLKGFPQKILIDEQPSLSVASLDPLLRKFLVVPAVYLKPGKEYKLFLTGDVTDFSGNEISRRSFSFGIPEKAEHNDIVFNEILFNPHPDESDYLEFYNCSDKIADVSRLFIASVSNGSIDTTDIAPLCPEARCFMPGTYFTVTTDRLKTIERYPFSDPENIFTVSSLPSMPDDRGHLLLFNREMELIDEVIYTEKMHYSLITDNEGVSLEKIRPELKSSESENWHSASENSGWGTPGAENSVFSVDMKTADMVQLSSERISPDNNGFEDVLMIDLSLEGLGNTVSITIFDETGRFIKRLRENFLTAGDVSVVWDATASDGSLVRSGIYIILIELYNNKGKTKSWKKVCAVVR